MNKRIRVNRIKEAQINIGTQRLPNPNEGNFLIIKKNSYNNTKYGTFDSFKPVKINTQRIKKSNAHS